MASEEKFTLSIGNNITGSPLSILGYRLSQGNGASLYIQGGTHGGEVTFLVFKMLYNFLKTNTNWAGMITLIPLAHPVSWNQRSYFYTSGKFNNYDGKDWNRSFPGNEEGSTSARISHILFSEAIKHDLAIDLHTTRTSKPFVIVGREDLVSYGTSSGILPTYLAPKASFNYPFTDAIDNSGKKGITLECGSHDSMDIEDIKLCFEAVLNMMRKEGLLKDKDINTKANSFVYTEYDTYFSPVSGFLEYINPLEKMVNKGDVLYKIHPSDSLDKIIDILAREDCIIMKYQRTHIATVGDEVVTTVVVKK